ncbi:MAG: biotin-dependent carboxyltransferase family protein [Burkholderiales bacterium]
MTISVIRAGVQTTVQDLGRHGFQRYGVPVCGAMDAYSLEVANLLVGNDRNAAGLEMTLDGPALEFDADTLLAVCGADLSPHVGATAVPNMRPVWIVTGSRLEFGHSRLGCRAYFAVAGGLDVPAVLGSRSTYSRAALGGIDGRAVKRGDHLAVMPASTPRYPKLRTQLATAGAGSVFPHWSASVRPERLSRSPQIIRFVAGRHWELLSQEARSQFASAEYRVGADSDRMGYRLEGAALESGERAESLSEPTAFGTIQLPPDGNPIVLMADRQTTGGYPRIGEVASVDLPLLAQLKPLDRLRFERIALTEAQRLLHVQAQTLAQIREAVNLHLHE